MESLNFYNLVKNDHKVLFLILGKYVKINLVQNRTIFGFVRTIDPEGHRYLNLVKSFLKKYVLLLTDLKKELCGNDFETVLILGHAVLDIILIKDPTPKIRLSDIKSSTNLVEKKQKLISWLTQNRLTVTESEDNIDILGQVKLVPPYDICNLHSANLFILSDVKKIMEKMPNISET